MIDIDMEASYPRFKSEVVVIVDRDRLIIDGSFRRLVLNGKTARELVPRAVELMDGTKSVAAIERELDIPSGQLLEIVSSLKTCGLVEEYYEERHEDVNVTSTETLQFLRRLSVIHDAGANTADVFKAVAATSIVLVTNGDKFEKRLNTLQSLLVKSGVSDVRVACSPDVLVGPPLHQSPDECSLVLGLSFDGDETWHSDLDKWCRSSGGVWLRAVVSGKHLEFGPAFGQVGACYECFSAINSPGIERPDSVSDSELELCVGLIALQLLYFIFPLGMTSACNGIRRYSLEDWISADCPHFRVPGCTRCEAGASESTAPDLSSVPISPAYVFESVLNRGGQPLIRSSGESRAAYFDKQFNLQMKSFPLLEQVPLPYAISPIRMGVGQALGDDPNRRIGQLLPRDVGTLMRLTAGVKELLPNVVRRWTSSAGNLGSVELYLAIPASVGEIPSGLYSYEPQEHHLASLRWKDKELDISDFVRRMTSPSWDRAPELSVIVTGALQRLAPKYGAFGYRLLYLDAGVAISQLMTVARSLNLHQRVSNFIVDDCVVPELRLVSGESFVTGAVGLSVEPFAPLASERNRQVGNDLKMPAAFRHRSSLEIYEMLVGQNRSDASNPIYSPSLQTCQPLREAAIDVPLSGRNVNLSTGLWETLRSRQSIRQFTDAPVALDTLATLLHHAASVSHANVTSTGILVVIRQGSGVESGVYEYDSMLVGLRRVRRALSRDEAASLFVDAECGDAPVQFWIVGSLSNDCNRYGPKGYQKSLVGAGLLAHRISIAATAVGLSGSIVAGVVPENSRRILGIDGYLRIAPVVYIAGYALPVRERVQSDDERADATSSMAGREIMRIRGLSW